LVVRDQDGNASKRKVLVIFKDAGSGGAITPLGGGADPTVSGGQLTVFNPTTTETDTFALPAAHWKAHGHPAGARGYTYSDRAQADGPCERVVLKPGKLLKARCRGAQITFTLNEPTQGSLAVKFTTGSSAPSSSCMAFSGPAVLKDIPAANGKRGVFKAKGGTAPAQCPVP
jgi:hypothetical protein